jgi:hypothetical protein
LIILSATVPFLGKAFHIDDPLYLAVARQILSKPHDPYGADILWERAYEPLFDADFNPPLWSYLLAGVMAITGEPEVRVVEVGQNEHGVATYRAEPASRLPEIAMHGLEAVFVAAAIVACFSLSRRFVRWPATATALVALGPAMLPGQNVMLEGPVMAFWLGCVWCYVRCVETDDVRWRWAAGLLASLALMTKYTSVLVLALVTADLMRRRRWRDLWLLVPPAALLAVWCLHNWLVYERLHALVIFSRSQTGGREPVGVQLFETWGRTLAVFRAIGATTALAIPVVGIVARRLGMWPALLLVCLAAGVSWLGKGDMAQRLVERDGGHVADVLSASIAAHVVVFGMSGALALVGLVLCGAKSAPVPSHEEQASARQRDNESFLWLWAAAVIVFGIVATPFLAVRHLLPGIPPLVWLVLRRLEWSFVGLWRPVAIGILGLTTFVSALCGFLVAKADYDFAQWYRHLALDVASRTVEAGRAQGKNVWYTGHWGWAYYAERVGMRPYIPGETSMNEGDYLLLPQVQTWQLPPKELYPFLKGRLRPIQPVPRTPPITGVEAIDRAVHWCVSGVRSISNEVHLYGPGTLTVPWQFSRRPLDFFNVIEVEFDKPSEPAAISEGKSEER